MHSLLYDLDEHVRMMDVAGIDAAWLTSAAGMCADLDTSRLVNDKAKKAERDYPGRFIGAAHAHPLGGAAALKELNRCRHELGFQGVTVTSEFDGKWIDDPGLEPFWDEVCRLGMFVFVHPALKLNHAAAIRQLRHRARRGARILADHGDDPAHQFRRVRPPSRTHRAHGASVGRHRRHAGAHPLFPGQGVLGHRRQCAARRQRQKATSTITSAHNLVFDTAGFAGGIGAIKAGLAEIPASRMVFATDYPQEIRKREVVRDFVDDIRALGPDGERILSGNVGLLLKESLKAHA